MVNASITYNMESKSFNNDIENTTAILANMQNICRICLSQNDCLNSLFTTKESTLLSDMFTSFTSIKVSLKDGLPLQICNGCKTEIVTCYQFRTKCKKSHSILKALIRKGSRTEKSSKTVPTNLILVPEDKEEERTINSNFVDYRDTVKGSKQEQIEIKVETEVKSENGEVTEVEYLEEGIFEYTETRVLKSNECQDLSSELEENRTFKNLLTETTQCQENSSKMGKRRYYTCSLCNKKCVKTRTLKAHMKRAHGAARQAHACAHCRESFASEHDLHIHSALHAPGPALACNQCHKLFQERGKLRRHLRRHMASKRHACAACGKQFAERCALRRHARVHTGQAPEKKHACHICDKRYSESAALAAHVLRHAGLRPCACDTCGKAFPSPRLLASHRRVHSDRKPHACRYCDKRFRHESTRNTHHRTHTGEKPYVCSTCGKTFIQNSNLTLHMRTHTGEKPYSCDICERKFSSGSALASHRRTHTGEKPYGCPVCGKRFARVYLNSHMRQHTGERPFACCVCPKRFANAARLRQHHLIHTGEKPFECAICSQKFKTKGYLAKHLKNHEMIKNLEKRNVLILQRVGELRPFVVGKSGEVLDKDETAPAPATSQHEAVKEVTVEVTEEMPMEVTGELILPHDNDDNIKTELLVIDRGDRGNICLTNGVKFDSEMNNSNDVNLVTVNENGVNIASTVVDGTTVKLYQLDQSLVQIHTSGGQVTISKITSKMTANF